MLIHDVKREMLIHDVKREMLIHDVKREMLIHDVKREMHARGFKAAQRAFRERWNMRGTFRARMLEASAGGSARAEGAVELRLQVVRVRGGTGGRTWRQNATKTSGSASRAR